MRGLKRCEQRAARDENGKTYYTDAKDYKEWEEEFVKDDVDDTEQGGKTYNIGKLMSNNAEKGVDNSADMDYNKNIATASSRYLDKDDPLFKNAGNIKPIEGYEDIVAHGDRYSIVFRDKNENEENISAKDFAEILKKDPNYKGGNIRLIACEAGAGDGIIPQCIANELNVEVLAPTELVQVFPDGEMFVTNSKAAAILGQNTGEWKIFKPKTRK